MILRSLWLIYILDHRNIDKRVAANREATEPRFPFGKVEVITSKMLRRHHDLVNRNGMSVSRMTTYIFPPVVSTSRSFPHS